MNGQGKPPPAPYVGTPYAERYVIAADNLRRRQLLSALLHGSGRTWREQRRAWPGIAAGLVIIALVIAAIAVFGAFRQQEAEQKQGMQGMSLMSSSLIPTGSGL